MSSIALVACGDGAATSILGLSTVLSSDSETVDFPEHSSEVIYASDANANDSQGLGVVYALSGGADISKFGLSTITGNIWFTEAQDFENPSDVDQNNIYEVEISAYEVAVSDDLTEDSIWSVTLAVNVTNVNEAPAFTSSSVASVVENSANAIYTATVDDIDIGDNHTFTVVGGDDRSWFSFAEASLSLTGANLSFTAPPDYESASDADGDNAYEVVIRVTDTGGLSADLSLTVNVTDVNEAPKITSAVSDLLLFENISGVIYEVLATDDENDTLSYQLSGSDSPAFSISGSAVSFSPSPDYEFPSDTNSDNVYSINIEVSDGNSVTIQALDVTVADRNDNTPVIRASQNFVVKENSASGLIFGVVEATDADASATTYQDWKIISGNSNSAFSIDPSSGELSVAASSALDHESDYVSYDLILTVSDGANTSASTTVSVYVDDVNEVPVIAANQIFAIDENTPDDTGFGLVEAEDADAGDILQDWAIESGNTNGAFALNASTGVLSVANSSELDYESTTGYFLTITVSDGNLTSAAKTVTININDVNDNTPFITAGQSLSIEENSANNTSLGTVTYSDADSAAVNSFVWGIIEGNTDDVFAIDNSGGITVATSSELDYETLTSYTLKLQVSDGVNTSNAESLTIDIKDLNDNRPEIEAGKTFQIYEDSADNTYVGAVNATDADSASVNTFTWSITSGNDGDIFAIETASADASGIYASSGDIIVANSSVFDYESISSYKLTIIVSDGNSTSFAQTFRVNLENVNEAPYFTSASTATISENNVSFIYIAAADDYDAGDSASLSYSLVGGADKALFDLNGDQLTFKNAPDYETLPASGDNTYEVELEVTDTGGLSDKLNLSISVVDVNDNAPVITAKQTFTIDENSDNDISLGTVDFDDNDTNAVNTFAWQITGGNTNDAFHIDSEDGELSVAASSELDHESTPSYTIKLIVSDGQQASAETNITINVNDVNEAPVINSVSATEVSVAENINYETYIVYRATATSSGDTPLATDPEGDTLSYSLSGEDNASFAIDPSDGIIKFQAAPDYDEPSDANKNNEYEIIIEVSDSIHIAEHALTVKLTDVDEPPVINNSTFSISVNENIATEATIYEVNATDPDKQTLTYSLDTNSDDYEYFSISANGQIRFANVPNYENPGDANADNTYQVTIQVSDGGLSTSQQLTIAVSNINEAPTADAGVDMEVNEGVQVTLSASYADPDEEDPNHKETIAYSWQEVDSNNNPLATVDLSNADIATPSFASPSNISADTNITFQLTVTDDAGNGYSATDTIVITVNNSPTVDAGANQHVTEGEQVTLTGSASDTNEGSIEIYSWAEVDSSGAEVIPSSVIYLSVTDTDTISFTAPQVVAGEDNEGIITLTFQLTVTDNDGAQEQSVVEVAVENLPVIQSVYLDDDDSAYGIGDTATVYIQAANSETDLKLKEGTFNGGTLSNFAEDGGGNDGLYSASYLVESAHSSVTAGGTVTTNIVLEDAYGHESTSYTPVTLDGDEYIDTVPPSQTISTIEINHDTGISDTDFITNIAAQTITAELNDSLEDSDILYGSVASDESGPIWVDITNTSLSDTSISWSTTLSSGADPLIQFKVVDAAGNDGQVATQAYTLDTKTPSQAVTLSSIKLSADTGTADDDFITNTAEQTISAELNASLGSGDVLYASVDDGTSWAKIYTESNLSNQTSFSWNTSLPAEGTSSIQFQVADSADNNGSLTEQNYTLDQTAPALAVTISSIKLSADTGTADDDFITNTAAQTISAELNATLGTGDVLYASVDDGENWAKIYDDSNLSGITKFSWATNLPAEGTSSIQFQVTDLADNNGSLTEQNYTLDQTVPALAVTLSSIELSADTGTADDDFITNTSAQIISAELNATLGTGDVLYASVDDGASWAKIYTDSNLSNQTSFSWNTSLPAEGNSSIQFQVADLADNNGSLTEQNYTLDQTAPALAVTLSSIKLSADTGTTDDDFITNTAEQTISAELNASLGTGDVLYASVDDGANWAKIYTGTNLSSISFSWDTTLLEGTSSIQFQVADSADNNGSLTEQNYTLDITAPALAVTLSSIKLSTDTGTADDDFITNTAAQTISAELNASLSSGDVLYASVDSGGTWQTIDSASISGTSIAWATTLVESTNSIQFQVADSADNNGSLTEQSYTLDITAPALEVALGSIKLSADTGTLDDDFITNTAEQTISAELNATLGTGDVLYASVDDGANWAKIYTDGNLSSISFSWDTTLLEGNSSIQFQVADSADNNGSLTKQNYTLDQTAPALAVTLSSIKLSADTGTTDDDFITNTAAQTISAELNASLGSGDVLYASVDDGANWAKIYAESNLSSSTSFSWTTSLLEGTSSIQFQVADSADNNGSLTEQNYTLDQTVPALAVTLSSIKLSADTGTADDDFITNTAAQIISAELNATLGTGDVLYASVDDGANWAKIYTGTNLSSISFSWDTTLLEGTSSIQFQVADLADNNGSLTEQNYTLDQTAPALAVTLSSIKLSADTGTTDDDFITNTAEQTISAELNASLGTGDVLYASVDDGANWAKIYTGTNLSSISFSWDTTLLEGTSSIQFQVADSADNNGSLTEQSYTLDITAPALAVTLSSIKLSTDTGTADDDFITNTAAQTISAELNASLSSGDVLYASVDSGGTWQTIDSASISGTSIAWATTLVESTNSIQFQVADSADNNGSLTEQSYTLDITAPALAVTLSSIKLSADTGTADDDFITNTAAQTISAELNASLGSGDVLYASVDDGANWAKIYTESNLSGSTRFSWTTSLLEGNNAIQFQVADSADNNGSLTEQSYTLDITAPSQAVTLSSIKLSADTGSSNTDFITNTAAQTISAELNASLGSGDVLYASVDDGTSWAKIYTGTNLSSISFSWDTTLLEGNSSIQFQVADSADNNGSLTEQNYTLDITAPALAVTLSSIQLSADTGTADDDFITNTAAQTISAELNAILGSGDVLYASVDDGANWAKIYDDSNLSGITKFSWNTSLPAEGTSSIQFQVADSADNNGSLTEQNYTLDQTAPALAVTLSSIKLSADTGTADDDFITNTAAQTISAELNATLGIGDVLYASVDSGGTWQTIDNASISGTSITWATTLVESTNSIQFQVADSADNNGSLTEQSYTLDITAPSQAVTLSSIKLSADTGTADDDFITNTAAQTISAELNASLGTGDVLYASVDDGANWAKIYTDSNLSNQTSFSWNTSLLEGNSSIQFQVADFADNNGSLTEQNYTLDITAPSQAVTLSSIKLSADTGTADDDFITNTAAQTISAELNASLGTGDVLYASVDDGANWAKIYTDSNLSNQTSFSWNTSLPAEGTSSIQFQVADSADNNGSLTEQNYTLDQTAPSLAVTLSSIKLSTDTGSSNTDFITNTAEQTISAELNASLGTGDVLYASVDDGASWAKIYTESNLSTTSFSWSTTLPAEDNSSIQFQVADSADNNGSLTEQNYTLDQTAPVLAVTLSSIKLSADTGTADDDFITNIAAQTISAELNATLGIGDVLYASVDDGANWAKIYTESNLSSISFSWDTSLLEGTSSIQFQVADFADNNGSLTEQNYTLDITAPALAVTLSSIKLSADTGTADDDFITNIAAQTISAELNASLDSGDVVYASVDDGANWSKIYTESNLSNQTSFSWNTSLPAEGTNSIQFQVADSADNNGSLTEQNYTLDQTAPALAVTLSSIKLSADTGTADDDFITNTAAQTISAELNANLGSGDVVYASVDDGASWAKIYTESNLSTTSFSWFTTLPAEDNSSIQFQVADSADNNGSLTEQNYTLDITAPALAVTLSSIKLSADTGTADDDFITNIAAQTISAELNASLGSGDVLYASVDDGANWAKIYIDGNLSITSFAWPTTLPAEGTSSIQFQVADSADNNGSLTEQNYTLDITAPALAVTLSSIKLSADTGTVDDDFITNTAAQTISAELNAILGSDDVLYASVDDGANWAKIYTESNLSGSTSFSWTTSLLEGSSAIQFQVADSVDNNGSLTEQNYTLDITAPALAVTLGSIKLSTDTGTADDDFITNTAAQTISAELNATLGIGDVLYASVDDGANWAKIYNDGNLSTTSFSWSTTLPAEGNSSIQFQVADLADNNGSLTEQNYTLDITAPVLAVTLSSIKLSADTGTADDDFITNIAAQTISAELNASLGTGDVLYASVDDGENWAKIYTDSNLSNQTSFSWNTSLPAEGTSSIQFQVADSADNNGSLTEQNYTLDQTAPSLAVTLGNIKLSADTGTADDDFITNTAAQTISAELNAILGSGDVLYASVNDGTSWAKIYTDSNLSGITKFSWTTSLPAEGNSSIQFQVADSADNNASLTEQNYTLDTIAPTIAITSVATDGTINASEVSAVVIDGAASENGQSVALAVTDGTTTVEATPTVADGIYSATVDLSSLTESASISLTATILDTAGNDATAIQGSIIKDTIAPSISSIFVAGDNYVNSKELSSPVVVSGATSGVEDSQPITININGQDVVTYVIASTFTIDADLSGISDGTYDLSASVADAAGNPAKEFNSSYVIETVIPNQAVKPDSISLNPDTGSSDSDFIINQAAQTISAELNASLGADEALYASVDSGSTWLIIYDDENLTDANTGDPTTSFSWATTLQEGTHSIYFRVTDTADNNATDTTQLYTLDLSAPQITSAATASIAENTSGTIYTAEATDTETSNLTLALSYSLSGTDAAELSIDSASGAISFASPPDFETPTDASTDNTYEVTLEATDPAGNSTTQALTITVTDVNDVAPVIDSNQSLAISETGAVGSTVGTVSVTDADTVNAFTWSITDTDNGSATTAANPRAYFDIEPSTGQIRVTQALTENAAGASGYDVSLNIQVNDGATDSAIEKVTITVQAAILPDDFGVAGIGAYLVKLTWEVDTSDIYDVYRSSDRACNLANYNSCADPLLSSSVTPPFTDIVPESGITYYYWLHAERSNSTLTQTSATPISATPEPRLNDTGINWGGDYSSGNNSDCSSNIGATQDCDHGLDAGTNAADDADGHAGFSYIKLDSAGNALSASATEWSCVRDNVTGLIWEVKTDDDSLHDKDDTYNWYNTDSETNGGSVGYADDDGDICHGYDSADSATFCNTEAFVARVNSAGLCGAHDWRLPNAAESHSLTIHDTNADNIDTAYFPNTETSGNYWSDSPADTYTADKAWQAVFRGGGSLSYTEKGVENHARLVRGDEYIANDWSDKRYIVHNDGTVTDTNTSLMWMQCSLGQYHNYDGSGGNSCTDNATSTYTWETALEAAEASAFANYTDWRIPNIRELFSLTALDNSNYLNSNIFPIVSTSAAKYNYWTSSPSGTNNVFLLKYPEKYLGFGQFARSNNQPNLIIYVRLVRSTD